MNINVKRRQGISASAERTARQSLLGSLANEACVGYPPTRHNYETMIMTTNTHTFLLEAAEAASTLPCSQKRVDNGYVPALAERWMR